MFKNILVALDGSKHAKRATVVATDLAQRYGSKLQFITVTKKPPAHLSPELQRYMEVEQLKGTADALVTEMAKNILTEAERYAHAKGVKDVKTVAKSGPVARTIVDVAKRQKADVIVMGSRGLSTVGGLLLGSVSHKVVSLADCNVMTVR
ncbi:MAG TPA: universal stress protein [Alphaproteobacteria bacterium]|nr:universal stress protein [Alphaproteobacteria bacterium]